MLAATPNLPSTGPAPVKMSTLARLSGVPAATIKHYLREGLLPAPELKTSRNMAFYDPGLAVRIQQIKALQREHFLPLRVIKALLDGDGWAATDVETAAAIHRTLDRMSANETRTRAEVIAAGAKAEELDLFRELGVVEPQRDGERGEVYAGIDLAMLRVLSRARKAGLTADMLPTEILGPYVEAIGRLVRVELEMFRRGVVPKARGDLPRLTEAATQLSEELVVLLRRKLLMPTLRALVEASAGGARDGAARPKRRPTKRRATRKPTTR